MTIDELLAAAGLTANDEIPIWDAEATGEPTKKITAQQMAAGLMALGGYLSKNFSQFPTAVTPYANTDLVPLYRNGTVYSTDMQTLINSAGGGGGTQQGALSNYVATFSFSAANTTHTFADSNLTAQMVIVAAYAPDGVYASLTPNITDGSITFTGTVSADCSIVFYFGVGLAAAPLLLVDLGSNVADNLLKAAPRPGVYNVLGLSNGGTGVNATDNADLLDKIGVTAAIQQSTAMEDVSANISSTRGTFNVKTAYKLLGIAVIVFELNLTSSVSPGAVIMSGIPYPKGRYINIVALNGTSPVALYTDGTNLVSNANINTGNTLAGSMVYVVN